MASFSVEEVAKQLAVGARVVLYWIKSGQLVPINTARDPAGGRPTWRIEPEELARFKLSRLRTPPPPRARRRKRLAGVTEFY